ncbi:16S rRNA (uracil(1498)-N(3))-methyltransferase [Caulobacter sp. NIBR1757]|uniref:16S rRNA (uracil(1498)-N(3))-methyltransferase n=1 Tax=Caulobacter sp. NIBR1757 TaxID=3016000 RepID=UPI0022F0F2A6|nr:16S rRNA (uracil(1498)-N(3))-methyltransferase [Caulobacter sp. NIBR1757]WGM37909.1 Ribosomal RNA small subunit methyltransferase E [Caulobacter sp. NIBR1757]
MIRLFVNDELKAGAPIAPGMEASRYLIAVMRLAIGSEVLLFNGRDGEWRATVVDPDKRRCRLTVGSRVRAQETGPDLTLVMALVKRGRLETIIEKAAELGAARVQLVLTRRTNADKANVERLQAIAIEAAEQTGRLDVPEILPPVKLSKLIEAWDSTRRLMFCDETGGAPVLQALSGAEGGPWAILIGPEGGFDPEEAERLRAMDCASVVSLGPRILRADTAAISAMTLWQASVGDWRG